MWDHKHNKNIEIKLMKNILGTISINNLIRTIKIK